MTWVLNASWDLLWIRPAGSGEIDLIYVEFLDCDDKFEIGLTVMGAIFLFIFCGICITGSLCWLLFMFMFDSPLTLIY